MISKKDVEIIKRDIDDIKTLLVGNIKEKADTADRYQEYLNSIKLRVKSIVDVPGGKNVPDLRITLEIDPIIIEFNDEGEAFVNSTFRAINGLNLLDMQDTMKLVRAINNKKIKKY